MSDEEQGREDGEPGPGRLTKLVLRIVDALLGILQRLRNRLEAPEDESLRESRERGRGEEEAEEAPRQPSFFLRLLIVAMCLLIGGVGGTLFSYRLFSKMLDANALTIDFMQETIGKDRKEESRLKKSHAMCLAENSDYWKQMHEAQRDSAECRGRVEELEQQVAAAKPVERAPAQTRRGGSGKPKAPPKTGDCTTGTANLADNLANCIDKFNRP